MLVHILVSAIALLTPALAAPVLERQLPADAPYTQPTAVYKDAIVCPRGIHNKTGGIVFLVHGTGSTGNESWAHGPYNLILPNKSPGFDICWVDLPHRAMGDAQLSAEYVAYGISYLAPMSATKQVNIIGHSQGAGFNPQWALTFWPSTRQYVKNYIGVAPDFHGTTLASLGCTFQTIIGGCQPSVWQQSMEPPLITNGFQYKPSHYIAAQNSEKDQNSGGQALVPTSAIYTRFDNVIHPEAPLEVATSRLRGAAEHALQDTGMCGPLHYADHFTIVVDPAAYGLAYAILLHGPKDALSHFDKKYCSGFVDNVLLDFSNIPPALGSVFGAAEGFTIERRVESEPMLQPYVCKRGYAPAEQCQDTPGFEDNYVR